MQADANSRQSDFPPHEGRGASELHRLQGAEPDVREQVQRSLLQRGHRSGGVRAHQTQVEKGQDAAEDSGAGKGREGELQRARAGGARVLCVLVLDRDSSPLHATRTVQQRDVLVQVRHVTLSQGPDAVRGVPGTGVGREDMRL